MHLTRVFLLCFALNASLAWAQLAPEKPGVAVLPPPTDSWFLVNAHDGSYLFDGKSGEMLGLMSHQWYTPAAVTLPEREETYYIESFYSRGVRGKREDVLTVVDMKDLSPKAEIDIPDKAAALWFRHHIGLLGDERHLLIFNMTPAQSISVVDVIDREFDGEISTPGCAIIMPTGQRAFLMICGDGTLQYIELDADGKEGKRERTQSFFDVEQDAVFDRPVLTSTGWLLISRQGLVYAVGEQDGQIDIAKPWPLLNAEDSGEKWRPGGDQPFALHRNTQLLYVLMHQGEVDTHSEPGTEVWVFDVERRKRVGRMTLEHTASNILASQEERPSLYAIHEDGKVRIYDGIELRHRRTIDEPGPNPSLLQTLTQHD